MQEKLWKFDYSRVKAVRNKIYEKKNLPTFESGSSFYYSYFN